MSFIIIILLILILILFYIYKELKTEYETKCLDLNFWKKKYKDQHIKLNKLVKNVQTYLDKHKIKYWAHAGTLLGTVRHGGFIPWDDDVDLGFLNEVDSSGKKIILNALNDLESNGFVIEKHPIGYKIYDSTDVKIFIDMFEFNVENGIAKQTDFANMLWPKENYQLDDLLPLKNLKFEDFKINVPKEPEKFCERAFGKDYMDIFYIHPPHYDTFLSDFKDGIGIFSCYGNKYNISQLN